MMQNSSFNVISEQKQFHSALRSLNAPTKCSHLLMIYESNKNWVIKYEYLNAWKTIFMYENGDKKKDSIKTPTYINNL